MKARLGEWLRRIADRVDWENAPRRMGWSFKFVEKEGLVWQEDPVSNMPVKGCVVWYLPKDYDNAFPEKEVDDVLIDRLVMWLREDDK
ncbi:MAG TPA: hypothetical protein VJQ25_00945 [Nitrospira sp.]|nr:hypothetical protein [Nitrospira sp.]